jgi:Kef-type K+ transport system membrane component KefB
MELLPFFLVLLAGVLFSVAFRRFHLPWVLALITAGIFIGPYGFEIVAHNPTLDFLAQIGLIFLMFMAGLETKLSSFKEFGKGIVWLSLLNAIIPFGAGFLIGIFFDFSLIASLLLGIIFMSSSIAVIVPTLEASGVINTKLGRSIISATILEDVASLVLLSVLLQVLSPTTLLPLPAFYFILCIILVAFRYGIPKLRELIPMKRDEKDLFESEVRVIIAILIGVVVTFEMLGLHPIIAGFFTGLVLSDSIKSAILIDKLRTMSYGIFIPVFFVVVGMNTDLGIFTDTVTNVALIFTVIAGSILTKFGSGWLGARLSGFRNREGLVVGVATIPQLSTTLAVVFTAVELGILQNELITAMVMLSIMTTLVAPMALRVLLSPTQ